MIFKRFMGLVLAVAICLMSGCTPLSGQTMDESLEGMRSAVAGRDYKMADRYARRVLSEEPGNKEAAALRSYLRYEDTMLVAAFWEGDREALGYLAGMVHDINMSCPRFDTPVLVLAAAWEHADMVAILLHAGADPNHGTDKDGYTALMWACKNFNDQLDMVRGLLDAGAVVQARSKYEETALSIAQEYGNKQVAALLKEWGADE
ncbi:MAG: ankyrin repeat domain-containing protein [Clostridia bacterium]